MRYRRVVIKLSGAALSGPDPIRLDAGALEHVADEVLAVAEAGVQVALVVGGGNFFRGSLADGAGLRPAAIVASCSPVSLSETRKSAKTTRIRVGIPNH
jgi:uridylate kinase